MQLVTTGQEKIMFGHLLFGQAILTVHVMSKQAWVVVCLFCWWCVYRKSVQMVTNLTLAICHADLSIVAHPRLTILL